MPIGASAPNDEEWAWYSGGDTGLSSITIFVAMTGCRPPKYFEPHLPLDSADFGRCYRLLQRFPAWRSNIEHVGRAFPLWRPLVAEWEAMTALYEELLPALSRPFVRGEPDAETMAAWRRFSHEMHRLGDAGKLADGWERTGSGSWKKGNHLDVRLGGPEVA